MLLHLELTAFSFIIVVLFQCMCFVSHITLFFLHPNVLSYVLCLFLVFVSPFFFFNFLSPSGDVSFFPDLGVSGCACHPPLEGDGECVKKSPGPWKVSDLDIVVDPMLSSPTSCLQSSDHIHQAPDHSDSLNSESARQDLS